MRHFSSAAILSGAFLLVATQSPVLAQQLTTPALHQRMDGSDSSTDHADRRTTGGRSTLPADVSGEYEFGRLNDSLEIDIRRNRLTGYITRLGDAETDNNTPITFFFDRTFIDRSQLEFQTKVVHGVWYSFHGTIVRGNGKTRPDEGYYLLQGVLLEHHPQSSTTKSADETYQRRLVNFKSMRQ
jgi:hypothetical protein